MIFHIIIVLLLILVNSYSFFINSNIKGYHHHHHHNIKLYNKNILLPDPTPNSIGNFFDNSTDNISFIQCYMLTIGIDIKYYSYYHNSNLYYIGDIENSQYGVGYPVDMPVMLTYFEGNELKPVLPSYPDYDHLMSHVANQLDNNDLQLYRTPVVLTLQGEFEDEELNRLYGSTDGGDDFDDENDDNLDDNDDNDDNDNDDDYEEDEEDFDDEDREEITVEELIKLEGIDNEDFQDDNDDDDDNEEEDSDDIDGNDSGESLSSFLSSSPAGKLDEKYQNMPDFTIVRQDKADLSNVSPEAFVTEEDTKSLKRAHRRADRIIEYADDISLLASFHFKKKNYHLCRLLEPIFIVGKRIMDIKGYYFTLLNESEGKTITPILEELISKRSQEKSKEKKQIARKIIKENLPAPDSRKSRRSWLKKKEKG